MEEAMEMMKKKVGLVNLQAVVEQEHAQASVFIKRAVHITPRKSVKNIVACVVFVEKAITLFPNIQRFVVAKGVIKDVLGVKLMLIVIMESLLPQ
ncbi:hypothetical protein DRJ17_07785 [Candidatus Woesearchaeota archaeon]|nr:MAG: hypothetical protein DRJ17_07785 [Candidatus Woesearchaeota archaeon]